MGQEIVEEGTVGVGDVIFLDDLVPSLDHDRNHHVEVLERTEVILKNEFDEDSQTVEVAVPDQASLL